MVKDKIVCPVCGRDDFKTLQGLSGHVRLKHELSSEAKEVEESMVRRGQYSIEETVKDLVVPEIADGNMAVFQDGIQFGVRSILVGVRAAQELSKLGFKQVEGG